MKALCEGQVFPIRLLGFGFYWAWLFLVTLSPSPILGSVVFHGLPAEAIELLFRLLFVVFFLAFSTKLSTQGGRSLLLVICCVVGPVSTSMMFALFESSASVAAISAIALVDAALFVLWLCFFGHMKVGETALYMALSYCIGGGICLAIQSLGGTYATTATLMLPAVSGAMFHLSNKYYSTETGNAELFSDDIAEREKEAKPYRYLDRLGFALVLVAFAFGSTSSCLYQGFAESLLTGAQIESICCLALAVACIAIIATTKQAQDLCSLYKGAPVLLAPGLMLLAFPQKEMTTIGVALVNMGYLLFEIAALNDYCIAAKSRDLPPMKIFCRARISITIGILLGWVAGIIIQACNVENPLLFAATIAVVAVVATPTMIFTEKEIFSARNVAEVQELAERAESRTSTEDWESLRIDKFADHYKLSARETEILAQMLRGRSAASIAERLFIAQGTVKTHTHNIYTKVNVHNKMELIDAFEEFEC